MKTIDGVLISCSEIKIGPGGCQLFVVGLGWSGGGRTGNGHPSHITSHQTDGESREDFFLISGKLCSNVKSVRDEPEPCNERNLVKSRVKLKKVPLGLEGERTGVGGGCGSSILGNYHSLPVPPEASCLSDSRYTKM